MVLVILGCGSGPETSHETREAFFQHLLDRCQHTYRGTAELTPGSDQLFASADLSLHVGDCSESEIWIGFGVDDDRSRKWLLKREGHELLFLQFSGKEAAQAMGRRNDAGWGGWASDQGTELEQHFPDHRLRPGSGSPQGDRLWTLRIDPAADRVVYEAGRAEEVRYRFVFHRDDLVSP